MEGVLLFLIVMAGTGGELCTSRAMKSLGEVHDFSPSGLARFVGRAARQPWMWLGITLSAVAFGALLAMLSIQDVSFVVPVTALSYAAGAAGARLLLGEHISRERWLGIAVVCLGVTLVWLSQK
ncbi:MAG TPA: EamA family transporter [Candidatus Acidoferrum sp.]|nr:EamA family transporter [Candidatus Acidoferrum sp.]